MFSPELVRVLCHEVVDEGDTQKAKQLLDLLMTTIESAEIDLRPRLLRSVRGFAGQVRNQETRKALLIALNRARSDVKQRRSQKIPFIFIPPIL
jgi:hypothetical protein